MKREEKKKKLLEFIEKKKEEKRKIRQQSNILKNLRKKEYLEREIEKEKTPLEKDFKLTSKRKKERKEKFLELIAKKREEEKKIKHLLLEEKRKRKLELKRIKQKEKEKKRLERIENREKLIQFLHYKRLHGQINKEKSLLLKEIINLKRLIDKERQKKLIEETRKLREEIKRSPIEKKKEKELQKREILQRKRENERIKTYLSNVIKTALEINKLIRTKITESEKNITNFITTYRKKIIKKKPQKVIPEKVKVVPEKRVKPVVYKEPFKLNVFLRRNIFKFVFLILLIVWLLEFLMFIKRTLLSSHERLKMIVGETVEEKRPKEEKKEVIEEEKEEKLVYWTKEKIDIEGKRDPFSTGRLTMEVMKKPIPTNIIFAKKAEVISIVKTPKFISILKPEEKVEKPKVPISPKAPSFEKPKITKLEEITTFSKLQEIEKARKPEITPFILPEKECSLIYRGRIIIEGVEYIFIEGTKRTYRVTIGDVVEGYRILKKENSKIILSKDGLLYEINAQ